MSATPCALCAVPVSDAAVCSGCGRRLELALGDVPALVADLETVLARLTVYSEQAQRVTGDRETSVPFDKRAAEVGRVLRAVLTSWVRIVWEERYGVTESTDAPRTAQNGPVSDFHPVVDREGSPRAHTRSSGPFWRPLPTDRVTACAGWLIGRPAPEQMIEVEWVRHQKWADEAIGNMLDAITDVRRALDAPAGRKTDPLGPCPVTDCVGEIRAYLPRDPDAMCHADCTVDPLHTWDSTMFLGLGKRMLRLEVVA